MKRFVNSFVNALRGFLSIYQGQINIWVMTVAAIVAIAMAVLLKVDTVSLAVVILTCGTVLSLEMINTALERLIDKLHPEKADPIGNVKDILSGAVLVASIFAAGVGIVILLPPLLRLIMR